MPEIAGQLLQGWVVLHLSEPRLVRPICLPPHPLLQDTTTEWVAAVSLHLPPFSVFLSMCLPLCGGGGGVRGVCGGVSFSFSLSPSLRPEHLRYEKKIICLLG